MVVRQSRRSKQSLVSWFAVGDWKILQEDQDSKIPWRLKFSKRTVLMHLNILHHLQAAKRLQVYDSVSYGTTGSTEVRQWWKWDLLVIAEGLKQTDAEAVVKFTPSNGFVFYCFPPPTTLTGFRNPAACTWNIPKHLPRFETIWDLSHPWA